VWCKSKKEAEEIRSFELSGKEIFSNYDETKSKEEKEQKERLGTAGCGRRLDEDQQKRRCASTRIV